MRNSNISFFLFIQIILLIILSACANNQAPSGGPPDTTPPEVVEVYPTDKTISFMDNKIILKFSKYMDKAKVLENFSISPNLSVEYDWSGKELEIVLTETPDSSLTYSVSLGTEYTDYLGNKPTSAFSLTFSTGSKIDSGFIAGKVFADKSEGAYIFAYLLDKINPDTLNPTHTKPDYTIQLGTSGEFRIPALKDATYRFFVINDMFKNYLYDPTDAFGSGIHDLMVINSKSEPTILKLGPVNDISGPILNEVSAIYGNFVKLVFSETLDEKRIYPESFSVRNTDNNNMISVKSASLHYENKSRVDLVLESVLDTASIYEIICEIGTDFTLRDTLGNNVNDSLNIGKFKAIIISDTTQISLMYPNIKDSSEFISINPEIELIFTKPVDSAYVDLNISLSESESGKAVEINTEYDGYFIKFHPVKPLSDNMWYKFEATINNLSSLTNSIKLDTSLSFNFKTIDYKIKGSISGKVEYEKEICDFNKFIILKHTNGNYIYKTKLENDEWEFKNIETGDYTAEIFCDIDGDEKYSYGNIYPFKHSEPFVIFEEVLKVKPRWTLENIILKVKSTHEH
ncbi:MAG: Ig-like domain-containing protein [Candidatus Kapaibacterium sp.]|jgi:hypothetical protein|nr:Ig-like domain-containing protein [Candidatus Kapabacteria bacterium]